MIIIATQKIDKKEQSNCQILKIETPHKQTTHDQTTQSKY